MCPEQTGLASRSEKHQPLALTQHPGMLETLEFPAEQKSHFLSQRRGARQAFGVTHGDLGSEGLTQGPLHHPSDGAEPSPCRKQADGHQKAHRGSSKPSGCPSARRPSGKAAWRRGLLSLFFTSQ